MQACLELVPPVRPPVPLHDEPRGVRRGLREPPAGGSSASAPSPWSEGAENEEAKRYAIDAVKRGREVLVIFPEGEIYYLNDLVQPFKSGAVDIGMQAVVEARRTRPDWTAYLVPMAIKYRYRQPIDPILERRTRLMEQHLFRRIQRRLASAKIGPHPGGAACIARR